MSDSTVAPLGRGVKPEAADPETAALTKALQRFHAEAGGRMLGAHIARVHEFVDIAIDAERGSYLAIAFFNAMLDITAKIQRWHRPICASCDRTFYPKRMPGGILLLLPDSDTPTSTVISGICKDCAKKPDAEIITAFAAFAKKSLWPDLRLVDIAQVSRDAGSA